MPDDPRRWLIATAKHRAIDVLRRQERYAAKLNLLGRDLEIRQAAVVAELDDTLDDYIGDDLLRLIFTAAHPVLSTEAKAALTLRLLGRLTTAEIARAFLITEQAAAQRIVRAKRTLAAARVHLELPTQAELAGRLQYVLEVIYLIFNDGYSATQDWTRPGLCHEALRLGRVLAGLLPDEPEVHGLVTIMEIQASRLPARAAADGSPVLLPDQDRRRWDRLLIRRGSAALDRAEALGVGPYTIQAAIAACHARAGRYEETDWSRIAALYEVLAHLLPSPVVKLNRAVAVGMARNPVRGLALLDEVAGEKVFRGYPQFPAARGELLARLERRREARAEFDRAAQLTRNEGERTLYRRRATELAITRDR